MTFSVALPMRSAHNDQVNLVFYGFLNDADIGGDSLRRNLFYPLEGYARLLSSDGHLKSLLCYTTSLTESYLSWSPPGR